MSDRHVVFKAARKACVTLTEKGDGSVQLDGIVVCKSVPNLVVLTPDTLWLGRVITRRSLGGFPRPLI